MGMAGLQPLGPAPPPSPTRPPALPSSVRTFFWHLVISGLLPDSEPCRAGCPESESLILDAKGIQSGLMNEGARSKAGRGLTLLESAGGGGLSSGMGISSPSFKEKRMLKMKHQLETVCAFSNQKNGIYRSRL